VVKRPLAVAPVVLGLVACNTIVDNNQKSLRAANKVDIVLAIDNEPGSAPKIGPFADAVAALLGRFANPKCLDGDDEVGVSNAGACDRGSAEFKPVTDIHVVVVTSSLGGRGAPGCGGDGQDDAGHAVTRGNPDATDPSGFLAWSPASDAAGFATAGKALASIPANGCRYAAQLESWYRFLVQPDPYTSVIIQSDGLTASLAGTDHDLLQQRHDFLRPDSAVAVILLSDHNDGSVDPRSNGGLGWRVLDPSEPMLRATNACVDDPRSSNCEPCVDTNPDVTCRENDGFVATKDDAPDLRLWATPVRFGFDALFPVARYVRALTLDAVPPSAGEHTDKTNYLGYDGEGNATCTNPLFASPSRRARSRTSPASCRGAVGRRIRSTSPRSPASRPISCRRGSTTGRGRA